MKYIITTNGGLGNQMINYALFRYLNIYKTNSAFLYPTRNIKLSEIFNLPEIKYKRYWYIDFYLFFVKYFLDPLYRRLRSFFHYPFERINLKLPIKIVEFLSWDEYSFIEPMQKKFKIFKFPEIDRKNKKTLELIKNTNSVSIHVRRGDYQSVLKWKMWIGDICDEQYYKKAINEVNKKIKNPQYFIFSDDIDWVKKHLYIDNAIYVYWNIGDDSYRDMQLMSHCKANITANSTFSLMGAILNVNDNPIRIAPQKWVNDSYENLVDRYLQKSKWIIINNRKPKISIIANKLLKKNEIKNILKQSYNDFELILPHNKKDFNDSRIKYCNLNPIGQYHFKIVDNIDSFSKKNFIEKWIKNEIKKEICLK